MAFVQELFMLKVVIIRTPILTFHFRVVKFPEGVFSVVIILRLKISRDHQNKGLIEGYLIKLVEQRKLFININF